MAKQTKNTIRKMSVKTTSATEHNCGGDCPCGCHKHGAGHRAKHILILVIVFILGLVCGKLFCCRPHHGMKMGAFPGFHPVFTNGCLDMQNMKNPKMQEKWLKADVNGDNCVSLEEYKAYKSAWKGKAGKKNGMFPGMKHGMFGTPKAQQPK